MSWFRQYRCPHARQMGIYGDQIDASGGNRAECLDCGKLLRDLPGREERVPRESDRPRYDRIRGSMSTNRRGTEK